MESRLIVTNKRFTEGENAILNAAQPYVAAALVGLCSNPANSLIGKATTEGLSDPDALDNWALVIARLAARVGLHTFQECMDQIEDAEG